MSNANSIKHNGIVYLRLAKQSRINLNGIIPFSLVKM